MADLYGNHNPQIPSRRVSMLGLGMPGNVQGKIDDGVRRSVGMGPKRYRLPGFPENPSLQGHPPLQWSVGQVGGIGAIPVRNVGDQARGMPPGPQRDSTTAVPMGGWQNHPSTRGLQEYKPTTPMYQRLHDITNPPPSPLIGSPGGGQGFFNVPPESNGGRFSSQSPGMPSIPIHWQPLTDGREVNTQGPQGPTAPPPMQPQSSLGQKPWWQRDLFTADDHLPSPPTTSGAHFPQWPSTPVLDKAMFGLRAGLSGTVPQNAAQNMARIGINVPDWAVRNDGMPSTGGQPQQPTQSTFSEPASPQGGQSSVWGLGRGHGPDRGRWRQENNLGPQPFDGPFDPNYGMRGPLRSRFANNGAMSEQDAARYVDQTLGSQQRYQQAKERAVMANSRPEPAALPASDLQPTAPLYPAHPYAGKFPIQGRGPAPVEVRDNGASNRTILGEINAGNIPSNLIPQRPGMTPEQAKYADKQAFENNKKQWAVSDKKRAENATREFEAQKLAYQRRRELADLAPRRRNMAESWIQSQFRQENPALFARGVNNDMLRYGAAMNARQRMDAPNLGGMSPQDAMLMRQQMYFNNASKMDDAQRAEARRMLGLEAPQPHAAPGVYPQQQQSGGGAPFFHPLSPMGMLWKRWIGG